MVIEVDSYCFSNFPGLPMVLYGSLLINRFANQIGIEPQGSLSGIYLMERKPLASSFMVHLPSSREIRTSSLLTGREREWSVWVMEIELTLFSIVKKIAASLLLKGQGVKFRYNKWGPSACCFR